MQIIGGIAALLLLAWPSFLIWDLIKAVVYRVTKDDDRPVLVAFLFMASMLVLAALCALIAYAAVDHNNEVAGAVFAWPAGYCAIAAGVVLIGLILNGLGSLYENLVDAIRGR